MSQYKLIVFDWDGTLMDSTGQIVNCMQHAIRQLDFPPLSDKAICHIIGLGLNEAALALYPNLNNSGINKLADAYRSNWLSLPQSSQLFDNARHLIQQLNTQDYFVAVATGKSRKGLDKVLLSTELGALFHGTRCADECQSKPHPQMIEELMDYFGVLPSETLMIGDTEYDLNMAHYAGADSLGVSHGAHDIATLQECNPKHIVANLYEAEHWLASL